MSLEHNDPEKAPTDAGLKPAAASTPAGPIDHLPRAIGEGTTLEELLEDEEDLANAHEADPDGGPRKSLWNGIGPGLITGAADDDPSGIATYSQAGAQFGLSLGWVMLVTWPVAWLLLLLLVR